MKIPPNVFVNITKWMAQGPWPDHLQLVLHEHLHAYCDEYDIDGFEELGTKIGAYILSLTGRFAGCRGPRLSCNAVAEEWFSGHGPLCYVRTD